VSSSQVRAAADGSKANQEPIEFRIRMRAKTTALTAIAFLLRNASRRSDATKIGFDCLFV